MNKHDANATTSQEKQTNSMPKRGFHWSSKAWYAKCAAGSDRDDHINIGLYWGDGSTSGEFSIEWKSLYSGRTISRLCVLDAAWSALLEFQDILQGLAKLNDKDADAQTIVDLLLSCGVEDMTKYAPDP